MSSWKTLGELTLVGVIHTTDEVTIYVTEEGPGHLAIHFLKKQGILSQLPRPNKEGAIESKAFRSIWKRAIGDHPLLSDASPQSFSLMEHGDERILLVEVHGLPAEPSHTPKTTNGVAPHSDGGEAARSGAQEMLHPGVTQPMAVLHMEDALGPQPSPEEPAEEPVGDEDAQEATQEATQEVAQEDTQEVAQEAPAPEAVPMAAAPVAVEPVAAASGELSSLPLTQAPDPVARLAALQEEIAALEGPASLERLARELGQPASARRLAENLFLHTTYGKLALEQGQQELARDSLSRAFTLDPRDREVLTHYGALLRSLEEHDEALRVDRNLLLHHRRSLSPQALARVYRDLGQSHFAQGDLEAARQHFEQALEANASDRAALDLLLKTVEAQGDVEQLIRTRQRLLDQMRDPAGRAMLRVAIGDDYRDRLHDPIKAMEAYEAAVEDHPEPEALSRVVDLAGRLGDWHRSALASVRIGDLYGQGEQAADSYARAAQLYQHELGNWEKASASYDKALDAHPSDLSHFTELVSLLAGGKQWARLQKAYQDMIARVEGTELASPELMGALWLKLGEVERLHMRDLQAAREAYGKSLEYSPEDLALHEQLGHMLAESDSQEDRAAAVEHYQKVMDGASELRPDILERLGVLHLHLKDYDAAFCELRALTTLGHGNDKARAFVAERTGQVLKPLSRELDAAFLQAKVMAPGYEPQLAEVYGLAAQALRKLFAHDLERYKLRGRDRIDQNQDLIFNKVYHTVGRLLGYEQRPPVYKKDELKGMFNAELYPSGFLVGGALLSGASEKEIAFTTAKQLYLFHDESFLIQTRLLGHLQIIFYAMAKAFDDNVNVPCKEDDNFRRVVKALRKQEPTKQARFQVLMEKVLKLERINLEALQTSFEDTANRVGLLVCDDLAACQSMLELEPKPINAQRSVEQRMAPLIAWSTSASYKKLRQTLGQTLGPSQG